MFYQSIAFVNFRITARKDIRSNTRFGDKKYLIGVNKEVQYIMYTHRKESESNIKLLRSIVYTRIY